MTSRYGLTVDQAMARLKEAERITDEFLRLTEYQKILNGVRSLGYHDGSEEERCQGSWG